MAHFYAFHLYLLANFFQRFFIESRQFFHQLSLSFINLCNHLILLILIKLLLNNIYFRAFMILSNYANLYHFYQ